MPDKGAHIFKNYRKISNFKLFGHMSTSMTPVSPWKIHLLQQEQVQNYDHLGGERFMKFGHQ